MIHVIILCIVRRKFIVSFFFLIIVWFFMHSILFLVHIGVFVISFSYFILDYFFVDWLFVKFNIPNILIRLLTGLWDNALHVSQSNHLPSVKKIIDLVGIIDDLSKCLRDYWTEEDIQTNTRRRRLVGDHGETIHTVMLSLSTIWDESSYV